MLIQVLQFLLGLAALVAGAEALVRGATRIALSSASRRWWSAHHRLAGTSAPEAAVSVVRS